MPFSASFPGYGLRGGYVTPTTNYSTAFGNATGNNFSFIQLRCKWIDWEGPTINDFSKAQTILYNAVDYLESNFPDGNGKSTCGIELNIQGQRYGSISVGQDNFAPEYLNTDVNSGSPTYPGDTRGAPFRKFGGYYFPSRQGGDSTEDGKWLPRIWGANMDAFRARIAESNARAYYILKNHPDGDKSYLIACVDIWDETALLDPQSQSDSDSDDYRDGIIDLCQKARTAFDAYGGTEVQFFVKANFWPFSIPFTDAHWRSFILEPIRDSAANVGIGMQDVKLVIGAGNIAKNGCNKNDGIWEPKFTIFEFMNENNGDMPCYLSGEYMLYDECDPVTGQLVNFLDLIKMVNGTLTTEKPQYVGVDGFIWNATDKKGPYAHWLRVANKNPDVQNAITAFNALNLVQKDMPGDYPLSGNPIPDKPTFSVSGGQKTFPFSVTISDDPIATATYYRLDGQNPTDQDTLYSGSINITGALTLTAVSYTALEVSQIASVTYSEIPSVACPIRFPGHGLNNGYTKATSVFGTQYGYLTEAPFSFVQLMVHWDDWEGPLENAFGNAETILNNAVAYLEANFGNPSTVGIHLSVQDTRWGSLALTDSAFIPDYIANDQVTYPGDTRGAPYNVYGGVYFASQTTTDGKWLPRLWGPTMEAYRERKVNAHIEAYKILKNHAGGDKSYLLALVMPINETYGVDRDTQSDYSTAALIDSINDIASKTRVALDAEGGQEVSVCTGFDEVGSVPNTTQEWFDQVLYPHSNVGELVGTAMVSAPLIAVPEGACEVGYDYTWAPKEAIYHFMELTSNTVPTLLTVERLFYDYCNPVTTVANTPTEFAQLNNGQLDFDQYGDKPGFVFDGVHHVAPYAHWVRWLYVGAQWSSIKNAVMNVPLHRAVDCSAQYGGGCISRYPGAGANNGLFTSTTDVNDYCTPLIGHDFKYISLDCEWHDVEPTKDNFTVFETKLYELVDWLETNIGSPSSVGIAVKVKGRRKEDVATSTLPPTPDYIIDDLDTYPGDTRAFPYNTRGGMYYSGTSEGTGGWEFRLWGPLMAALRDRIANVHAQIYRSLKNHPMGDRSYLLAYVNILEETFADDRTTQADYDSAEHVAGIADIVQRTRDYLSAEGGHEVTVMTGINGGVFPTDTEVAWEGFFDDISSASARNGFGIRTPSIVHGSGGLPCAAYSYTAHVPKETAYKYMADNHSVTPFALFWDSFAFDVCDPETGVAQMPVDLLKMVNGTLLSQNSNYDTYAGFVFNQTTYIAPYCHWVEFDVTIPEHLSYIYTAVDSVPLLKTTGCGSTPVPPIIPPDAPSITPSGGVKTFPFTVTIVEDGDAEITTWTDDGSIPIITDTEYTGPFSLTGPGPKTFRAVSFVGGVPSAVSTETYLAEAPSPSVADSLSNSYDLGSAGDSIGNTLVCSHPSLSGDVVKAALIIFSSDDTPDDDNSQVSGTHYNSIGWVVKNGAGADQFCVGGTLTSAATTPTVFAIGGRSAEECIAVGNPTSGGLRLGFAFKSWDAAGLTLECTENSALAGTIGVTFFTTGNWELQTYSAIDDVTPKVIEPVGSWNAKFMEFLTDGKASASGDSWQGSQDVIFSRSWWARNGSGTEIAGISQVVEQNYVTKAASVTFNDTLVKSYTSSFTADVDLDSETTKGVEVLASSGDDWSSGLLGVVMTDWMGHVGTKLTVDATGDNDFDSPVAESEIPVAALFNMTTNNQGVNVENFGDDGGSLGFLSATEADDSVICSGSSIEDNVSTSDTATFFRADGVLLDRRAGNEAVIGDVSGWANDQVTVNFSAVDGADGYWSFALLYAPAAAGGSVYNASVNLSIQLGLVGNSGISSGDSIVQYPGVVQEDLIVLRDGVVNGLLSGWNYSISAGTGTNKKPQYHYYKSGSNWLRKHLVYGVVTGEAENVVYYTLEFSDSAGSFWNTIGVYEYTYDLDGVCTNGDWVA